MAVSFWEFLTCFIELTPFLKGRQKVPQGKIFSGAWWCGPRQGYGGKGAHLVDQIVFASVQKRERTEFANPGGEAAMNVVLIDNLYLL